MSSTAEQQEPLQLTIDKFGRVVIPQQVREALGLAAGTKLVLSQETATAILLKVVEEEPHVEERNGWIVITGDGEAAGIDTEEILKKNYAERDLKNGF